MASIRNFGRLQNIRARICPNIFYFLRRLTIRSNYSLSRGIGHCYNCSENQCIAFGKPETTVFGELRTVSFSTESVKNFDSLVRKSTSCLEKSLETTSELLEYAMESQGTVYFDRDMKDAKNSLNDTLLQYNNLLLNAEQANKKDITETFGRRVKELAAFKQLIKSQNVKHHH